MSPLSPILPAACVALFQEELLIRINALMHEGRELVFYCFEIVVGDRLRDGCEAAPMACRVREPRVRQPGGGEQEGHALCLCGERWRCFLRLAGAARERMNVWACLYAVLVQRAPSFEAWLHGEPAPRSSVLAAIDGEIPEGSAGGFNSKPRKV